MTLWQAFGRILTLIPASRESAPRLLDIDISFSRCSYSRFSLKVTIGKLSFLDFREFCVCVKPSSNPAVNSLSDYWIIGSQSSYAVLPLLSNHLISLSFDTNSGKVEMFDLKTNSESKKQSGPESSAYIRNLMQAKQWCRKSVRALSYQQLPKIVTLVSKQEHKQR